MHQVHSYVICAARLLDFGPGASAQQLCSTFADSALPPLACFLPPHVQGFRQNSLTLSDQIMYDRALDQHHNQCVR